LITPAIRGQLPNHCPIEIGRPSESGAIDDLDWAVIRPAMQVIEKIRLSANRN
jgi:hypothetical protein